MTRKCTNNLWRLQFFAFFFLLFDADMRKMLYLCDNDRRYEHRFSPHEA